MALPIASVVAGALIDPTTFGNEVIDALNAVPRGTVGYAQQVNDQGGFTGPAADITYGGSPLSVTFTAVAGRRYKITADCFMTSTVAGDLAAIQITNAANSQLQSAQVAVPTGLYSLKAHAELIAIPGAGSVTYKVRAYRAAGSGTVTVVASAAYPAFILVEDIGT